MNYITAQNYFKAISKVIEKSTYFWEQHILANKRGDTIEANMWEQKWDFQQKILYKLAEKAKNEKIWIPQSN